MVLHEKVWIGREVRENSTRLVGCPFNGRPLSVMQYPTRESSPSDRVVVDSVPVNGDVT